MIDQRDKEQAPIEARLSEAQLRDLTSSLPHLVWTCLADGPCDYLSKQWVEYTGIAEAEQLGFGWLQQLHSEDRPRVQLEWTSTVGNGVAFDIEFRIRRHDGIYKWFRTRAIPLRDPAGTIVKWYGSNTDIDDYKQALDSLRASVTTQQRVENELRRSEQRLATTLLSIGDAVIATDAQARVTRMNPIAEQLTGWPLVEALGRPVSDVFDIRNEDTGAVVESPVTRVLREGRIVGLANHTVLVARDRSRRPIADSGAPIRDVDGTVQGVVLVFRDQTDERAAEKERLQAVELTAENRRVQEASRLKSEFLANMSHELRTPLNSIIGFGELLMYEEAGPLGADQKEFVGNIVNSGRHLLQLINDVLDLSKVEAGKMDFRPERVIPSTLVEETLAILRTSSATRGLRMIAEIAPELDEIFLDPARLKQVLYNYLSNAIKFTDEGGTVVVRLIGSGHERFVVEVEDSGIGIATEDLGKLFVEFQQLDAGATKRHGGTGLGLALTRRLVEAQGGEVGVSSTPGQGSVFRAILPRRQRGHTQRPAPFTGVTSPSGPAILVVEDNPSDRDAITSTLRAAGYEIDVAETVAGAIAKCRERTYVAVTLDLVLPDGSGLDVLQSLRGGGPNRDVRVVVVTVVAEPGAVAGFAVDDLLAKPLVASDLVAALRRAGVPPVPHADVWVIDDDPGSRRLMVATLEQLGLKATAFADGPSALLRAGETTPIALVVDLLMPEMDGFELIDRLRMLETFRSIPIIVWTVKDLSTDEYDRLRRTAQLVIAKGSGAGGGLASVLREVLPEGTPYDG